MADSRFSNEMKCGHCQNLVRMPIKADFSKTHSQEDGPISWDYTKYYEILECPACFGVSFQTYWWADHMEPSDVRTELLYPRAIKSLSGLPDAVERAYEAARKVRAIDANAYGVLLGRVLELVCEDRGAQGGTLDEKLKSLADIKEIPEKLVKVAAGLRRLRNIGAHAGLGELTEREVPVLDDLTRAILDYVYSAPYLANLASERLAKLTTRTKEDQTAASGSSKKGRLKNDKSPKSKSTRTK